MATPRHDKSENKLIAAEFTYGGGSKGRITVDDGCYVVWHSGPKWRQATWLFREAVIALKSLPDDPREIARKLAAN